MSARLARMLPAVVVAGLAAWGAPAAVRTALERFRGSSEGIAHNAESARRALRGGAYEDVVEEMSVRVAADGAYAVADEGGPSNVRNFVKCDLAPRKAVLLLQQPCGNWLPDRKSARVPDLAVVVATDGVIRAVETRTLLSSLWSGLAGPESDIPGWLDEPAEGKTVAGRFAVGGWCQEKGRPCAAIRVWVDSREVAGTRIERFPRPGVCAAVPELGDCGRAGWRVTFEPGELAAGHHCVAAALVAADGRHRRIGPWAFAVAGGGP